MPRKVLIKPRVGTESTLNSLSNSTTSQVENELLLDTGKKQLYVGTGSTPYVVDSTSYYARPVTFDTRKLPTRTSINNNDLIYLVDGSGNPYKVSVASFSGSMNNDTFTVKLNASDNNPGFLDNKLVFSNNNFTAIQDGPVKVIFLKQEGVKIEHIDLSIFELASNELNVAEIKIPTKKHVDELIRRQVEIDYIDLWIQVAAEVFYPPDPSLNYAKVHHFTKTGSASSNVYGPILNGIAVGKKILLGSATMTLGQRVVIIEIEEVNNNHVVSWKTTYFHQTPEASQKLYHVNKIMNSSNPGSVGLLNNAGYNTTLYPDINENKLVYYESSGALVEFQVEIPTYSANAPITMTGNTIGLSIENTSPLAVASGRLTMNRNTNHFLNTNNLALNLNTNHFNDASNLALRLKNNGGILADSGGIYVEIDGGDI